MPDIRLFLKEKRLLIIIVVILLICSIAIAFGVYAQITNREKRKSQEEKEYADYESLKSDFKTIFTNTINKSPNAKSDVNYEELLYTAHDIKEEKEGKYTVEAHYPQFKGDTETQKKINSDIYNTFGKEMVKISKETKINTTFNLDYVGYVNENIISLVIMCKYKDGENAQRKIVACYNYDIENDKLLTIDDIISYKGLNKNEMQKKVTEEIKKEIDKNKDMVDYGYGFFVRDENSEIYKIENTPNFFLGKDNYLYLVYSYGNDTYTDDIDLVIFY